MGYRKNRKGKKKDKDVIVFKTEEKAKKFLKQFQSLGSKYSRTTYYRKGKKVYRY